MDTTTQETNTQDSSSLFYGKDAITGNEETVQQPIATVIQEGTSTQVQLSTGDETSIINQDEQPKEETKEETKEEPTQEPSDVESALQQQLSTTTSLSKALTAKGVDFKAITAEYDNNGGLSKETYDKLSEAGYPKEVIDGIIKANEVVAEQFVNTVVEYAGGHQTYQQISSWMEANLSQSEIKAYNKALDKGDLGTIKLFLSGVKSKLAHTTGTANRTIMGGTGATPSQSKGFANKQEMIEALSDRRYGVDPEYTRQCERKVLYSNFI